MRISVRVDRAGAARGMLRSRRLSDALVARALARRQARGDGQAEPGDTPSRLGPDLAIRQGEGEKS